MICEKHDLFFPQKRCPICEKERKELEYAIRIAEIKNSEPIILWDGRMR